MSPARSAITAMKQPADDAVRALRARMDAEDDEDQCPDCGMVEYECVCDDDDFAEHDADDAIKDALYEDGAS